MAALGGHRTALAVLKRQRNIDFRSGRPQQNRAHGHREPDESQCDDDDPGRHRAQRCRRARMREGVGV